MSAAVTLSPCEPHSHQLCPTPSHTHTPQILMFQDANMLDLSREDMGVISISQTLNKLGVVESANWVALTMFGYHKRDLVGKNISALVPSPMNARHDTYLRAYLDSGRSVVSCLSHG